MTFEQWVMTRRFVPDLRDEPQFSDDDSEGVEPGFVYEVGYIQLTTPEGRGDWTADAFYLHVGNQEWTSSDLGLLERHLWEAWAEGELS